MQWFVKSAADKKDEKQYGSISPVSGNGPPADSHGSDKDYIQQRDIGAAQVADLDFQLKGELAKAGVGHCPGRKAASRDAVGLELSDAAEVFQERAVRQSSAVQEPLRF